MKLLTKITTLLKIKYFLKEDTLNLGNKNPEISKVFENQEPAVCDELSFVALAGTPGWIYTRKMLDDKESIEKLKILIKFSYKNRIELKNSVNENFKEIFLNDLFEMYHNNDPFEFFKRLNEKYSKSSSVFSKFSELLISLQQSLFTAYTENKPTEFISSFEDELTFKKHILGFLISFTHTCGHDNSKDSKFQILNKKIRPTLINSQWDLFFARFVGLINENYKYSHSNFYFTFDLDEFIALRCENIEFLAQKFAFALDNNDEDLFTMTFDAFIEELKLFFFNEETYNEFKDNKKKFMYLYQVFDVSPDQTLDVNN